MSSRVEGVEFDDSSERIQFDALWNFLSNEAQWGRWRTKTIVRQQIDAAWRVVGAYEVKSQQMVGFARAVSDGFGVAYLADVYVVKSHRGRGVGHGLVDFMINRGPGATFRWMLHTRDAHNFYARLGFVEPDRTYLERPSPLLSESTMHSAGEKMP